MDDEASSSPAASYIRLVQHLIEKCICYKLDKEECIETLEKHAKIMPVITSTVWKELEKENKEFFETYKKDRGGANQEEASAGPGHHPSRVQQSGCSSQALSTLQKNPSDQQEQRIPVEIKKEKRKNPSDDFSKENPSVDQKQRVMEKQENRKNNPCASNSSDKDK